ncbi:MAG: hypothetical protein F6J98_02160 [Moorea sp. SIO4G2]|nr:hypothetical protein [Moorena sp. SIO4G2]
MPNYEFGSQADGSFEIQGLREVVFDTCSEIAEEASAGAPFFNPDTQDQDRLSGRLDNELITLEGVVSPYHFQKLEEVFKSPRGRSGELSAIHEAGGITTTLKRVRLVGLRRGAFDKMSNDVVKFTLRVSFSSTKTKASSAG